MVTCDRAPTLLATNLTENMSITGIASHRALPYREIHTEWDAMIMRIASVCPIYYSTIGIDFREDAEVAIDVQYSQRVGMIEAILFSNPRLDPLLRYGTEHLIVFIGRQRLASRRQMGRWKTAQGIDAACRIEVPPDAEVVSYRYGEGLT
jgi:hypothetical protein